MDKATLDFAPTFASLCERFGEIQSIMISAMENMPRIETLLFEQVEGLVLPVLAQVKQDEELVLVNKARLDTVIIANQAGPEK